MPVYVNAVEDFRPPESMSVHPGDRVMLDGGGARNLTIECVRLDDTVDVRVNPNILEQNVPLSRVWLVRPNGLTPEELAREAMEEKLVEVQRQMFFVLGEDPAAYGRERAADRGKPAPDEVLTP